MSFFGLFPPDVAKLKMKGDVEGLIKVLNYKRDGTVRSRAAIVFEEIGRDLRSIGDTRPVEPLIKALNDEHSTVRIYAALALGQFRDERAVEPLIMLLKTADDDLRYYVVKALGKISDARAVGPLVEALKSRSWSWTVLAEVATVLGQFGDARAVEPLVEALKDKYLRPAASEALKKIRGN